uniref:Uncharacterized protein n=1 Tax=Triticum urartu TaxID=4572 RepID=A0A8R7JZE1_TRIUA
MMVVVTVPFLGPRRVDRLLEPLDAAGDDDGAFVRVPVLVPRLPEQLQDQGVAEQRHRHREPPRRLALLLRAHPERRASLGDRRRRLRVRSVVAGGGPGEEVAARFFLVPLHRSKPSFLVLARRRTRWRANPR